MGSESLRLRGGIEGNGKRSLTADQAADQLTREGDRWGSEGSVTVTYAFRSSGPVFGDPSATFSAFTQTQIDAAELALSAWSDVARISFVRVGSGYSGNATILFGNYRPGADDPGAAFALFPGSSAAASPSGDVWISADLDYNQRPLVGDYGQQVLVHEIGHAIGLGHPSDYDASDPSDPTYGSSADYYEDSRLYTIMSYFASAEVGADLPEFAAAPQMDDIAAVQKLYGVNGATRSGDTVYGFNATADRPWYRVTAPSDGIVFTAWDGGGYDRFDFSGYRQDAWIDLRQGAFSDVGGSLKNVGIAVGTVIEEAVAGAGNDVLIANDDHGALLGGSGADQLTGGRGNDHLYGGGRAAIAGDGADTLNGGAGHDYLQGNAGDDLLDGAAGEDRIYGGQGSDRIEGGDGNDSVNGNLGDDQIRGSGGNDFLRGGQGNDQLWGGNDNDQLLGDLGDDVLRGDAGFDWMSGGGGSDRFWVTGNPMADSGLADLIVDYEEGIDRLIYEGGAIREVRYASFAAETSAAAVSGYARTVLTAPGDVALAVGWQGDTILFTRAGDLDAVRIEGLADMTRITPADFVLA